MIIKNIRKMFSQYSLIFFYTKLDLKNKLIITNNRICKKSWTTKYPE